MNIWKMLSVGLRNKSAAPAPYKSPGTRPREGAKSIALSETTSEFIVVFGPLSPEISRELLALLKSAELRANAARAIADYREG